MKAAGLLVFLSLCTAVASADIVFDGEFAALSVNDGAQVTSIREKPSGRELLSGASPLMSVGTGEGKSVASTSIRSLGGNRYALSFQDLSGQVEISVVPYGGGWSFTVVKETVAELRQLAFFALKPSFDTYVGWRMNAVSDDRSCVCVRAYDVAGDHHAFPLSVSYGADRRPLVGVACGLAAGPREKIPEMMRNMAVASGVLHSECAGGWSLEAEPNRLSYYITDGTSVETIDDQIEIAERVGLGRMHFRSFWERPKNGLYEVVRDKFPRGLPDLCDCSRKAKEAGLLTSIHNLSGCVGFNTPWVSNELADGLTVCHRYTLACDIPASGEIDEILVNEKPASDHGYDFSTWSRGNTIRIGEELFQYADISFEKPYAFKKVKRARFGTASAAHAAGARADYLWCFFGSFLALPGSPLAAALVENYAKLYKAGHFDGIYCDGLDGYAYWPYRCDVFQRDFVAACAKTGKTPQYECSNWTANGWWLQSVVGSWDVALWSAKSFIDRHLRSTLVDGRLSNFQQITLGWWQVIVGSESTFGYSRDDIEYFGAKIAGHDCGFSYITGFRMRNDYGRAVQQVVLGWYEKLRRSRLFRPGLLQHFRATGRDFRLAQDDDGVWRVREAKLTEHRMASPSDTSWKVPSPAKLPAAVRVRALDAGEPWDGANRLTVLSAAMAPSLSVRGNKGVKPALTTGRGEHGATLKLTVTNEDQESAASWAVAERQIGRPFLNLWATKKAEQGDVNAANENYAYVVPSGTPLAIGAWVKGDGSGADVNLQLHSPKDVNNARSDHHLKLDFTGWRYFVFSLWRDHQPDVTEQFRWPYINPSGLCNPVYERGLACSSVEHVGLWMNGIRHGKSATVEISDVRVVRESSSSLENAVLTVNGVKHEVPFAVGKGEYAELEDGFWIRYSLDGIPLARVKATSVIELNAGENDVSFGCADPAARAWVTVAALGPKRKATVETWTVAAQKIMSAECDLPRFYAPGRNMGELAPMAVRPNEKVGTVSVTVFGPAVNPVVCVGGQTLAVGRDLGKDEAFRGEVKGDFSGTVPVSMRCGDAARTAATLILTKRYNQLP